MKSRRRNIGVITLILACVFSGEWLRGMSYLDCVHFPTGEHSWQEWSSGRGAIRGWNLNVKTVVNEERPESFGWYMVTISEISSRNGRPQTWRWWCDNFGAENWFYFQDNFRSDFIIPYWSIVVPLILLSACLLLSKPRSLPRQSSVEAID